MCQGGGHLGGASPQLLGRRGVVGELFIDLQRAVTIVHLEFGGRGEIERAGAPRVTLRTQGLQPFDSGFGILLRCSVHHREQRSQIAQLRIELGRSRDLVICVNRTLPIARPGHQLGNFTHGHTLTVDSKGNIYIAETDVGRRIQKFKNVQN